MIKTSSCIWTPLLWSFHIVRLGLIYLPRPAPSSQVYQWLPKCHVEWLLSSLCLAGLLRDTTLLIAFHFWKLCAFGFHDTLFSLHLPYFSLEFLLSPVSTFLFFNIRTSSDTFLSLEWRHPLLVQPLDQFSWVTDSYVQSQLPRLSACVSCFLLNISSWTSRRHSNSIYLNMISSKFPQHVTPPILCFHCQPHHAPTLSSCKQGSRPRLIRLLPPLHLISHSFASPSPAALVQVPSSPAFSRSCFQLYNILHPNLIFKSLHHLKSKSFKTQIRLAAFIAHPHP